MACNHVCGIEALAVDAVLALLNQDVCFRQNVSANINIDRQTILLLELGDGCLFHAPLDFAPKQIICHLHLCSRLDGLDDEVLSDAWDVQILGGLYTLVFLVDRILRGNDARGGFGNRFHDLAAVVCDHLLQLVQLFAVAAVNHYRQAEQWWPAGVARLDSSILITKLAIEEASAFGWLHAPWHHCFGCRCEFPQLALRSLRLVGASKKLTDKANTLVAFAGQQDSAAFFARGLISADCASHRLAKEDAICTKILLGCIDSHLAKVDIRVIIESQHLLELSIGKLLESIFDLGKLLVLSLHLLLVHPTGSFTRTILWHCGHYCRDHLLVLSSQR
mmetsp:Transcript_50437/g.119940  ORF Transcript_50437/g.119940 Transcript_50437/m.119940 type:complete len:334 (-) Transcript_50437:822-1823(-)